MSGSEKGAVDLLLEDAAKYLEDGCATDGILSAHERIRSVWHAVLYLSRAVKELAGRSDEGIEAEIVETLQGRIAKALQALRELKAEMVAPSMARDLLTIINILEGVDS